MLDIVVIAHNLRSSHNVGSLLRTAEGLGVKKVILSGYTPYPRTSNDERLPHISAKLTSQIAKTSLGAENSLHIEHSDNIDEVLMHLKSQNYTILALEQNDKSTTLPKFHSKSNIALIVGREVEGIEPEILNICDEIIEIPMFGRKESFNVVQAAAMALYHIRFYA
jgi:23S rRNA (guanosine2251-2'-O)-methyltransferase